MRRLATCAVLLLLAAFSTPTGAHAVEIREGVPGSPFRLADTGGLLVNNPSGDQSLVPPFDATTINGTAWEFEPRSVRQDSRDGSFLVACGKHGYVQRVMADGKKGALYTAAQIPGLERPFDAFPMPDGGMMIVDRGAAAGEGRVIRVDASNREVWRFGGTTGLGAGQVWDPFTAEPLGNGHTLIADSLGFRIIEVDDATGAIVWSYGTFNVSGPGPGLLIRPHSAQRLPNGNTLICDADGHTVLEVTPAGQKVWSYGTGAPGSGPNQLFNPNSARRTSDGKETIISDSDNNRVLVVDSGGNVLHEYAGAVSNPRAALRLADGTTMVADLGNMSLQRYGFRVGSEYVATSALINPAVGKQKSFTKLVVNASLPHGTLLKTEYTTDNKSWRVVPPDGMLPATATGDTIRYRLHLITDDWKLAPTVNDVTISWQVLVPVKKPSTSGSTKKATSGTASSGSGSTGTGTSLGLGTFGVGTVGAGTAPSSEVVPGSGSEVASGAAGTTGDTASGATAQTTASGWVMSETKEDVSWAGAAGSQKGPGNEGRLQKSAVPGVALLFGAYLVGIGWSPGAQAVTRLIVTLLPR